MGGVAIMTATYDATTTTEALPDDWESLVNEGIDARESGDRKRWRLGDIACKVEKRYGEDALGTFAGEIKVIPRTLRMYRQVAAFYPAESGTRELFPNLSYTDYRDCLRMGDLEAALDMLNTCSANNWTTRDLTDALNAALGRPPVRRPILEAEVTATEDGLRVDDALLLPGVTYTIKVYTNE